MPEETSKMIKKIFILYLLTLPFLLPPCSSAADDLVTVTAEGLVNPDSEIYEQNQDLMLEDLRNDARKQAIEKVVSMYVDSADLNENYLLVNDMVLTRSPNLIKEIVEESEPWRGKDGLMHIRIKAGVSAPATRAALKALSKGNRTIKLKEAGSPRISVAISVMDAMRDSSTPPVRSEVAENVFKKQMSGFGYRVWSEEAARDIGKQMALRSEAKGDAKLSTFYATSTASDFRVVGSVKFQPVFITMKASGIKIKKYSLNSWTVKCYNTRTGEELYFNNKIPKSKSWASEDQALADVGQLISDEFSADFFEQHLASPHTSYQLTVEGLPSWDTGDLLRNELVGLRSVLDVDFRSFDIDGIALYEIQFGGDRSNFSQAINRDVVKPINQKLGERCFRLAAVQGNTVRLLFKSKKSEEDIVADFENAPPSSLAGTSVERIAELSQSKAVVQSIQKINPEAKQVISIAKDPAAATAEKNTRKNQAIKAFSEESGDIDFGNYYGLLIGNSSYRNIDQLVTPVSDIKEISEILTSKYGFFTQLLFNAGRYEILTELNALRSKLTRSDNLLIYYAGHGWLDEDTGEGYWLPIDSEKNNPANWLSNSSITNILKSMEAKHVMIVSDSCYSGTLTRSIKIVIRKPLYIQRMAFKRARTVLASGGLEPVMDAGGKENHSVFASAFLEALRENNAEYIETSQLFAKIRRSVMINSDQTPEYSDVRKAGHDGGDFIFRKVN